MRIVTLLFGLFLIALGMVGYVATGSEHWTALIPAAFGLVFLLLGELSRRDNLRMHVMHAAALLSLIGFAATARGFLGLARIMGGGEVERPAAVISQSLMALSCLVYLALCIRSFVEARRRRRARETAESQGG
jgi:hypothetical protein